MADDEGFQIPEDWDVIVVGTDLTNSLVAAACAYAGQKVLHLDANSFYGQAQSSLSLSAFHQLMNEPAIEEVVTATEEATHEATDNTRVISILNHRKAPQPTMSHKSTWSLPVPASGLPSDLSSDPSSTNPSSTEPSSTEPSSTEPSSSEPSSSNPSPSSSSVPPSSASAHEKAKELLRTIAAHQQGNTDRATEAFDRRFNIDLVSQPLFGASPFIDLLIRTKSASYIDFRGIDQTLMLLDNGSLATVPSSKGEVFNSKVLGLKEKRQLMKFMQVCRSPDEQNTEPTESFESFLASQQLTPQLQSFVSNAIVMDRTATSPVKLTRSEAVQRLQLYLSSIGRFPNMSTPFIFPSYGASELPQAFCRLSAVVGTVYVLRNAPSKLLFNPEENRLTGAVLNNGQTLKANRFVFSSSSIRAPSSVSVPIIAPQQIARCVCITNRSLLDGVDNLLVTVPPAENALPAPVLALQLGTSMVVTPQNYWIVTFSSALASLEQLQSAVDRLLTRDPSDETKPLVLYQGSYLLHQTDNDAVASLDIAPSNLIVIPDAGLIDGPEMFEVSVANAQAILEALNVDFFPEERPDSSQQPDEPEAVEPTQDSEAAEPAETSEAAATSEAAPGDSAVQTAEETVPTQTAE